MYRKLLISEIQFKAVRSRGPGGQNVNKVSSAAQLTWAYLGSEWLNSEQKFLIQKNLSNCINSENEIYLRSDEFRDLERNKERCLEKLSALLSSAFHKEKPRKATKPTYSSRLKKMESKAKRGAIKKNRQKLDW